MRRAIGTLFFLFLSFINTTSFARDRTQLPAIFIHSYFGLQLGFAYVPYSNRNFVPGFSATSISQYGFVYHFFGGHQFYRYLAAEIGGYWVQPRQKVCGVNGSAGCTSIAISALGFFLKPLWPIKNTNFSLNLLLGGGIIIRRGFSFNNTTVLTSTDILSAMFGGGATYHITPNWALDLSAFYAVPNNSEKQPGTFILTVGGHYFIT